MSSSSTAAFSRGHQPQLRSTRARQGSVGAGAAAEFPGGLAIVADNEMHDPVFPNGCAICEVEIDPETGQVDDPRYASVDDVGRCINPLIVDGQTHGAIAQGIGQAMWEQCVVDPDSGQPLTGSFMDYGMPRVDTLPSFTTEIVEVLSPTNPLGIKAGGEGGTTAALGRRSSAPSSMPQATRHARRPDAGDTIRRIWQAIQNAKAGAFSLKRPRLRQHPGGAGAAYIIFPQLADVPVAIEVMG